MALCAHTTEMRLFLSSSTPCSSHFLFFLDPLFSSTKTKTHMLRFFDTRDPPARRLEARLLPSLHNLFILLANHLFPEHSLCFGRKGGGEGDCSWSFGQRQNILFFPRKQIKATESISIFPIPIWDGNQQNKKTQAGLLAIIFFTVFLVLEKGNAF